MSAENLTSEKLSDVSFKIRQEKPDYNWGQGELLNAIFEVLVIEQNLPWIQDGGYPDWDDPRVLELRSEVVRIMQSENKTERIQNIQARCQATDCLWEASGDINIEKVSRTVLGGSLIRTCRSHHEETGFILHHNRFDLLLEGEKVGHVSVSSQVETGYIKEL